MRFGFRGPVEVGDESGPRTITGAMPRTLLALAAAVADFLHLEGLGRLSADLHRAAVTAAHYDRALDLARAVRSPIDEAHALVGAARCARLTGDSAVALAAAEQALGIYERSGAAEISGTREYCAILRSVSSDTSVTPDARLAKFP